MRRSSPPCIPTTATRCEAFLDAALADRRADRHRNPGRSGRTAAPTGCGSAASASPTSRAARRGWSASPSTSPTARTIEQRLREDSATLETLNRVGAHARRRARPQARGAERHRRRDRAVRARSSARSSTTCSTTRAAATCSTRSPACRPRRSRKFPMPRNTAVFAPTFRGEGIVRSGDIRKDPRYGKNDPHFGMPQGPPAGGQLSRGAGDLALRRGDRRTVLRPREARRVHRARRARRRRHRRAGRDRDRQRAALRSRRRPRSPSAAAPRSSRSC